MGGGKLYMETMTVLKIVFIGLVSVPVLGLSLYFMGKLMDEVIERPGRQK